MNLADLPKPFFVLAPMFNVTESAFRQTIAACAPPHLACSESINVDDLQGARRAELLDKLALHPDEPPVFAQLWGTNPENFYKSAQQVLTMGYAGIDLNMGSPEQVVTGLSGTLMDDRELAAEVIATTRRAIGDAPLSVKTRLGATAFDPSWMRFLLQQPIDMLIVHGCTKQRSSEAAIDWPALVQARELRDQIAPQMLFVANGHVRSATDAAKIAATGGFDGIMIGRGIFSNPFAFAAESPWLNFSIAQRRALFATHLTHYQKLHDAKYHNLPALIRFAKLYLPETESADFQHTATSCTTIDELRALLG